MADGQGLHLSCRCGTVTGRVDRSRPSLGHKVVCHCRDCRAFATFLGATEALDANGATAIFQTVPALVRFETGQSQIRCLRLSPKGLLRWYAGCCGTPLGNTLAKPGFAFVGLPLAGFPDPEEHAAMGPILASAHGAQAPDGTKPPADFGLLKAGLRILLRQIGSKIGLVPRGTPYFDHGRPVAEPFVLSLEQRRAAEAGQPRVDAPGG